VISRMRHYRGISGLLHMICGSYVFGVPTSSALARKIAFIRLLPYSSRLSKLVPA
jgi:hypothetical protein